MLWSRDVIQVDDATPTATIHRLKDPDRSGLTFLDDRRLLTYEVAIDSTRFSSRISPDISSPFRMRVSVSDSKSGAVLLTKEWGTRAHGTSVSAASRGIIVRSGDMFRFLDSNLSEIKEQQITRRNSYDAWEVRVSPSRQTVVMNNYLRDNKRHVSLSHFYVLDGSTFQLRGDWSQSPALSGGAYSISDSEVAALGYPKVVLYKFGSKSLSKIGDISQSPCHLVNFVAEALLMTRCDELFLMSTTGETLFQTHFEKGESIEGNAIASTNGRVVALALKHEKEDFWDRDTSIVSRYVDVYDLARKSRILRVELNPLPQSDYDFALSPDGSKLAVLNDRSVTVCAVPAE